MTEQELREKIAEALCKLDGNKWDKQYRPYYYLRADAAISALKQANYVRLADDQSLPKTYFANRKKMPWITDYDVEVQTQQDMLKVQKVDGKRLAFRKVELKENDDRRRKTKTE